MLVMVVFFIAFRWIHLSTPLIRLFLLVLILLLMPTLNFLPVWFALSLLRFRLPSRLPMMFILWMVAMMVVIIPSRTRSEERFSRNAETDLVCRLLLEKKKHIGTVGFPRLPLRPSPLSFTSRVLNSLRKAGVASLRRNAAHWMGIQ